MKIGIYSGTIPPPVFINNLVNGLADKGDKVFIYGRAVTGNNQYLNSSIKQRKIPSTKLGVILHSGAFFFSLIIKKPQSYLSIINNIWKYSNSWIQFIQRICRVLPPFLDKLDIFHIQWAKTLIYYPEFVEKLSCPVLLSFRGAHINYSPLVDNNLVEGYNKYFPKVAGFHAVSSAISLEAQKYGADPKKITIIPPAVNIDLISDNIKERTSKTVGELEIISVGRCHWKKGYTFALDAMVALMKKSINFHYTIIAGGKDDGNILYQIYDLGLTENVTFINGLSYEKVIDMVSNSALFLLPSVEEGISNAVLEAMALGTPVISTDCGGMREVVINNNNGFLVPVREPNAMAEAIQNFINLDEKEINDIINNARRSIIDNHLLSHHIDQFKFFYNKIERG